MKNLRFGGKALTLASNKLNEIIESKFPPQVDYVSLDMIEFFLIPKEIITQTNMGKRTKLREEKFNEEKVEKFFRCSAVRHGITGTTKSKVTHETLSKIREEVFS
jgi:hypothetical protein